MKTQYIIISSLLLILGCKKENPVENTLSQARPGIHGKILNTNNDAIIGANIIATYSFDYPTPLLSVHTLENASAVELISFTVSANNDTIIFRWSTATEVNNYGFQLELRQSTDSAWSTMGFVAGHGTTNAPNSYTYSISAIAGKIYYGRLKQIDNDSSVTYSLPISIIAPKVIAVSDDTDEKGEYSLPTPSSTILNAVNQVHVTLTISAANYYSRTKSIVIDTTSSYNYDFALSHQ
jgi:hypothetical protein